MTEVETTEENRVWWDHMASTYSSSPIASTFGLTLEILKPGEVMVNYHGAECASNRSGAVAGGAIAQMVDSAGVQSVKTLIAKGDKVSTLELKVNFLRPGVPGMPLRTIGTVEHIGNTKALAVSRVETHEGKLVALGTLTVNINRKTTKT